MREVEKEKVDSGCGLGGVVSRRAGIFDRVEKVFKTRENAAKIAQNMSKHHQNTAKRSLFSHFLALSKRRKQV